MVGKWSGIVREILGNCSEQFRVKPVINYLTFSLMAGDGLV